MHRRSLLGLGAATTCVVLACSSMTGNGTSRPGRSGGASGTGESPDAIPGAGGSGGVNSGGTGGAGSLGAVSIEFTVTGPGSYCMTSLCGEGPRIDIQDSSGRSLFGVTSGCASIACDTCSLAPCAMGVCSEPVTGVAVTGATFDWDGGHLGTSTCGSGISCIQWVYAEPGRYKAALCLTPGQLSGPDAGPRRCVPSGPAKCGSVEFDFPSSTVVKGTVGS